MSDLFGAPEGKKATRTEWGLRQTKGNVLMDKGEVDLRRDEENARDVVGNRYLGFRDTEVVSRTVTTYTTPWETS